MKNNKLCKEYHFVSDLINSKDGYVVYLLLLIGSIIAFLNIYNVNSTLGGFNFIMNNHYFCLFLFLSNIYIVTISIVNFFNNELYILRIKSTKGMISSYIIIIILLSLFVYIISILLSILLGMLYTFGNYHFINDNNELLNCLFITARNLLGIFLINIFMCFIQIYKKYSV